MSELAELRLKLVTSREDLHEDEASLLILEAKAEQEIIDALPGETPEQREKALGPNVDARKRGLTIALGEHRGYQELLGAIRRRRAWNEDLQARIDNLLDDRREREKAARERLIDVLAAAYGVTFPPLAHDVDEVVDAEATELAGDALPGVPSDGDSRDIDDRPLSEAEATREWAEHDARTEIDAAEDAADAAALANGMPTRESLPF